MTKLQDLLFEYEDKTEQGRRKQYLFIQNQQQKTLSFQSPWCEEGTCRSRFHLGSMTLSVLAKSSETRARNSKRILRKEEVCMSDNEH